MPRKSRLTDEENFRGDIPTTKEEKRKINTALEASLQEDLSPSHWQIDSDKRITKMAGGMIDPSEWNLGNIPEPEVLDDGEEVKVTITSVADIITRNGAPCYRVSLEVVDRPLVNEIYYYLYKPQDGQTPRDKENTGRRFQTFMQACNLDYTRPFSPESDWPGESGWCIVGMREDEQYGKQNTIRKWILPK